MYIQIVRLRDNGSDTISTFSINGVFECFSLEDTHNEPKIHGRTRIPAGTYNIELRTEGTMTDRYAEKYSNHRGMLWLRNVPNFEYVYIHTGNTEDHTDGCILVGANCNSIAGTVGNSVVAYKKIYAKVILALDRGEEVTIQII